MSYKSAFKLARLDDYIPLTGNGISERLLSLSSRISGEHKESRWITSLECLHQVEGDYEAASSAVGRRHGDKDDGSSDIDNRKTHDDV